MIDLLRIKMGYLWQNDLPMMITKLLYGNIIQSGPFKGVKYVNKVSCSSIAPKILGSYEIEIQPIIEDLIKDQTISQIINIGAADGYYAVGLASKTSTPIIAYEADEIARTLLIKLAKKNQLKSKISVRGFCSNETLIDLIQPRTFFLVDIEGFEIELFDGNMIYKLQDSILLIETHTYNELCTGEILCKRFTKTHNIQFISQEKRPIKSIIHNNLFNRYLQNEHRTDPNNSWLYLTPK